MDGFSFWKNSLKTARLIVAPMVDQSELAWRILSRRYGAQLCYTPMLHASLFRTNPIYRRENFTTCPEDRPLIVQFCANDPVTLLEAARYVESECDAVDINLGCPQTIAKRGHYGAFLQDQWELIAKMVNLLHHELAVPVTCKIRVFQEISKTVEYAKMLEKAGCQLLTVHGRTRDQKGPNTGLANWKHIKAVKENVSIPVFANGNIQYLVDVERCFRETGVDGVMSAEGSLYNPAIFTGHQPPCWTVAEEYLHLARCYPPPVSYVRGHLFRLWHHVLQKSEYQYFRDKMGSAKTTEKLGLVSAELKSLVLSSLSEEELTMDYNIDSLPFWRCQPYIRPGHVEPGKRAQNPSLNSDELEIRAKRQKRKEEKCRRKLQSVGHIEKPHWEACLVCRSHPKGLKCVNNLCKNCCKRKCNEMILDCPGHKFLFRRRAISLYGSLDAIPSHIQ